jgi:hypothetical protein
MEKLKTPPGGQNSTANANFVGRSKKRHPAKLPGAD